MTTNSETKSGNGLFGRGVWIGLAVAAGFAFFGTAPCACKPRSAPVTTQDEPATATATLGASAPASTAAQDEVPLPRLLDLGAHSCIPCKMMAPILDELKKDYAKVFQTVFIDVWQDQAAGQKHGIRSIPTQIFFDAEGKELFRHEGFFGKEDILAKWKELGVDLTAR